MQTRQHTYVYLNKLSTVWYLGLLYGHTFKDFREETTKQKQKICMYSMILSVVVVLEFRNRLLSLLYKKQN